MVLCVGRPAPARRHAALRAEPHQRARAQDLDRRRPGRNHPARAAAGEVNPKIDWTFAKALRAFLRADPDVIMVGEIRDGETAEMAVEASLTATSSLDAAHQQRTRDRDATARHGPGPVQLRRLAAGVSRSAWCAAVHAVPQEPARPRTTRRRAVGRLHARFGDEPPIGRDVVLAGWMQRNSRDGAWCCTPAGLPACDDTGFKGRAGLHEMMVSAVSCAAWCRRRAARSVAAHRPARRHAHAAPGRHDKVLAGITHHRRSAGHKQYLMKPLGR